MYPRGLGDYPLHELSTNFEKRMGSKKFSSTHLDNADEVVRLARLGHDVWLRKYLPNADYTPEQIVNAFPSVPDDVKSVVGVVTNNEQDWGWARQPNETVHHWMVRARDKTVAVARLFYEKGYRRFTFGNFSMGTYDVTSQEEREEFGAAWRDLYNTQKLDGADVEWWLDMHNYVPDATWLYDTRIVPGTNIEIDMVADRLSSRAVRWGEPSEIKSYPHVTREGIPVVATWMEPTRATSVRALSALPTTTRTIHIYDWYLTRALFNFWPEMGVGLDWHIQRVRSTESGFDKGGVGGAPAQGYTARQVYTFAMRMNALLYAPLDVYGNGSLMVPSPFGGCTWFASSYGEWQGYNIQYVYTDYSIPVSDFILT